MSPDRPGNSRPPSGAASGRLRLIGERIAARGGALAGGASRACGRLGRAAGAAARRLAGTAAAGLRRLGTAARALVTRRPSRKRRERPARTARPRRDRGRREAIPVATIVARRDDDWLAVTGRIDTATEPDIMLLVPRGARALRSAAAWAHVAAHVRRRGIALGVVSPRGDVRAHARANGLRAARSTRGLRRGPWRLRLGARVFTIPKPRLGSSLRGLFLLAAVALAGVAACYQLPSARIVIVPASEPISREAQVRPQPLTEAPDISLAIVPAESVERQISATLATVPTGETEIGDDRATTILRFANASDAHIDLPADTVARTDSGTAFLTDEPVVVPPGESIDVGAAAEFPGVDGNVAPGEIGVLGTELPASLTVINPVAADGGTNILVPAVAQEDVDRLRELAPAVLARAAARALRDASEEATLLEETVGVVILTERPEALLGEATDVFLMDYTALASGLAVTVAAAEVYGRLLIEEALPDGVELLHDTVSATLAAAPEGAGGGVVITVEGRVHTVPDLEPLRAELTGVEPSVAAARLVERLGLEEAPRVTLEPEWVPWRWMPRRAERIAIDFAGMLEEPQEEGEAEPEEASPDGDGGESRSPNGGEPTPLLARAGSDTRGRARLR